MVRAGLEVRSVAHYHHCEKHRDVQADVVLEKELEEPHLDP